MNKGRDRLIQFPDNGWQNIKVAADLWRLRTVNVMLIYLSISKLHNLSFSQPIQSINHDKPDHHAYQNQQNLSITLVVIRQYVYF